MIYKVGIILTNKIFQEVLINYLNENPNFNENMEISAMDYTDLLVCDSKVLWPILTLLNKNQKVLVLYDSNEKIMLKQYKDKRLSFINSETGLSDLINCLKKILKNGRIVPEELSEQYDRKLNRFLYFKKLNLRQKKIVLMILDGNSNKNIGNQLYLSEQTIKNEITKIYKILKVKNRSEIMKFFVIND